MIVVDASVLAPVLADDGPDGRVARARLAGEQLAAPEVIDLEVVSVVRGLAIAGKLGAARADHAIEALAALPIARASHRHLTRRCWELHHNLTPYDAAYVALAEALEVPLVTADARLARASGPQCAIELLS
ncbi:type II toxin-antitoxin system VapC family toxin [Ruania zhangjianzhongii]|uniref:type II toxin-antitoxin system VapC family toxin n=1 Tax=Ruania zhangjianzhongii TaxID=2603206 RepID=UPI0011C80255|nr:type II toxin-antitoxin system VapC family toxin [Ruania zhangjianzhongii]